MKPNALIYTARYNRMMEAFDGKGFYVEDRRDRRGVLDAERLTSYGRGRSAGPRVTPKQSHINTFPGSARSSPWGLNQYNRSDDLAYGYVSHPGSLEGRFHRGRRSLKQIAAQIGTSRPDKPVVHLEINCRILERALHAMRARGHKFTAIEGAHGFGRTTK